MLKSCVLLGVVATLGLGVAGSVQAANGEISNLSCSFSQGNVVDVGRATTLSVRNNSNEIIPAGSKFFITMATRGVSPDRATLTSINPTYPGAYAQFASSPFRTRFNKAAECRAIATWTFRPRPSDTRR